MNDIFLKIIESSILASFFILAVIIIRLLFSKKTPKWIMCLLWSLIGIRLLVPVTIESDFSIIPDFSLEYKNDESSFGESFEESAMVSSEIEADISKDEQENSAFVSDEESIEGAGNVSQGGAENTSQGGVGNTSKDGAVNVSQDGAGNTSQGGAENAQQGGILNVESGETPSFDDGNFENEGKSESKQISISKSFLNISSVLWLIGTIIMLFYGFIKYIMLKRRVSIFSVYKKGIRKCEAIDTPFVLGVIKPYIYLPFNLSEKSEKYIIAHEKAHIKRLDYISKIIAFVVLSVHWFNPLVWVTFSLFCKDIEYACDEKVLKTLDTDEKKDYATALLECSIKGSRITACPVAFGEIGVKDRVKNAISYKKPLIWIVIISIILCAVLPVVFLTTKKNKDDNGGNTENSTDNSENSADELPIADEVLDENLIRLRRARKGDLVWFGKYEQDDNPSNGPEDIDWLVIEEEGTKLLVVSKYSLARIPYNEENVAVTWETCSVRKWLNEEFINVAFNDYERSLIPTVTIHDEERTGDLLEEKPTQDKVFLLSATEAKLLLGRYYTLRCETTKSAGEKKGDTYDLDHPWWLRSVSRYNNEVPVVSQNGSILERGYVPNNKYGCVRPAMWIDKSELLKLPENDDNMNNEITHEELEKLASAKVGDYVFFGKYEQDYVFSNGREAIEWQVLESKGNQRLLLSKYALDCRSYSANESDRYTLINWLDDEFYHSSFSRGEKELIVSTKREISENYTVNNKIMLLSTKDFNKYLKRNKASCESTAYAYARRIEVCDNGKVYWWLCSDLGEYGSNPVSVVNEEGDVKKYSSYSENVGVRPAVWIDLSVVLNPDDPNDESNDVVSPDELEKLKSAKVGDYIPFGKFDIDGFYGDKEVLSWRVLASENGKLLVVSTHIIGYTYYGTNSMQICYKDSNIRKWLIDYFYNSAFSNSEKSYISPTTITMKNIDSPQNSESVVIDKVFLLSPEEVDKYFVGDITRECKPTASAKGLSWWMRSTDSYHTSGYIAASNEEEPINNGYIYYYKGSGVRPAMWIDLER